MLDYHSFSDFSSGYPDFNINLPDFDYFWIVARLASKTVPTILVLQN